MEFDESQDRDDAGPVIALAVIGAIVVTIYRLYLFLCRPERWEVLRQRKREPVVTGVEAVRANAGFDHVPAKGGTH